MTNNHLLLYRLAELMLEKQQHILALDDLFEDEQIGAFVRSIQIDSPYQQLIFEGVLTETIKEERVMVTFTVEGYFHYVLGEVIGKKTEGKGAEELKNLLEKNKLRGITEGVEQCLIRDIEKDDLSRLMWLIDEGGKALEVCASPLAYAFSIIKGNPKTEEEKEGLIKDQVEKVLSELLEDETDKDLIIIQEVLYKLFNLNREPLRIIILSQIANIIEPKSFTAANLLILANRYIPNDLREIKLDYLKNKSIILETDYGIFFLNLGLAYQFIQKNKKALKCLENALNEAIKNEDKFLISEIHGSMATSYRLMNQYKNAIKYHKKAIEYYDFLEKNYNPRLNDHMNNLGLSYSYEGKQKKSIELIKKSHNFNLKYFGEISDPSATSLNNLALVNCRLKNTNLSLEQIKKSINIFEKIHGINHFKLGISYSLAGAILKSNKSLIEAIHYLNKSLKIYSLNNIDNDNLGEIYFEIGLCYFELKEYKNALSYLNQGFKHTRKGGFPNMIASCYEKLNEIPTAFKYHLEAGKIRKEDIGLNDESTQESISNCLRLAKQLNKENELPNWIKEDDQ